MRNRASTIAFATLLVFGATSNTPSAQSAVSNLGPGFQPLAADFNAASGHARLVVVLSPT